MKQPIIIAFPHDATYWFSNGTSTAWLVPWSISPFNYWDLQFTCIKGKLQAISTITHRKLPVYFKHSKKVYLVLHNVSLLKEQEAVGNRLGEEGAGLRSAAAVWTSLRFSDSRESRVLKRKHNVQNLRAMHYTNNVVDPFLDGEHQHARLWNLALCDVTKPRCSHILIVLLGLDFRT